MPKTFNSCALTIIFPKAPTGRDQSLEYLLCLSQAEFSPMVGEEARCLFREVGQDHISAGPPDAQRAIPASRARHRSIPAGPPL